MNNLRKADAGRFHSHWIVYLNEVANAGSIRKAAKTLNVAPSAISRRLRELEALVGNRLFERVPLGLRLTEAGQIVAAHVDQVLNGLNHMQSSLDELRGLERGHVTVAAVQATAVELLPRIVAAIHQKYSRITFTCDFMDTNELSERVLSGDADMGIAFNPPRVRGLRQLAVAPISFGAVMTPDHPLAKRRSLRIADLVAAKAPVIFPQVSISTRAELDRMLGDNAEMIQPVATSSNPDFVIGMTQFGVGIAIRTRVGVERELRDGSLVFVPIREPGLKPRRLTLLVHVGRPLSLAASLLAETARRMVLEQAE